MTEFDKDLQEQPESPERRELLAKAGRFAAATPAAVLVLLSTAKDADAHGFFASGGMRGKSRLWRKYKRRHARFAARKRR